MSASAATSEEARLRKELRRAQADAASTASSQPLPTRWQPPRAATPAAAPGAWAAGGWVAASPDDAGAGAGAPPPSQRPAMGRDIYASSSAAGGSSGGMAAGAAPSVLTQARAVSTVGWMRGRSHIVDVCVCSMVRLRDEQHNFLLVQPSSASPSAARPRGARRGAATDLGILAPPGPQLDSGGDGDTGDEALRPAGCTPIERVCRRQLCEAAARLATESGVAVGAPEELASDDGGASCFLSRGLVSMAGAAGRPA
jgi:hypothetical protein